MIGSLGFAQSQTYYKQLLKSTYAPYCTDGMTQIYHGSISKVQIINEDGHVVIDTGKYYNFSEYQNGYAFFIAADRKGFVDKKGKEVISLPMWTSYNDIVDGVYMMDEACGNFDFDKEHHDNSYMNPFRFHVDDFRDIMAIYTMKKDGYQVRSYAENRFCVLSDELDMNYLDRNGNVILKDWVSSVNPFQDGFALIKDEAGFKVIDTLGITVRDLNEFKYVDRIYGTNWFHCTNEKESWLIHAQTKNRVNVAAYDIVEEVWNETLLLVGKVDKQGWTHYGVIDFQGKEWFKPEYGYIEFIPQEASFITTDMVFGEQAYNAPKMQVFDQNLKPVTKKYPDLMYCNGHYIVRDGINFGVLNNEGLEIIPLVYAYCKFINKSIIEVENHEIYTRAYYSLEKMDFINLQGMNFRNIYVNALDNKRIYASNSPGRLYNNLGEPISAHKADNYYKWNGFIFMERREYLYENGVSVIDRMNFNIKYGLLNLKGEELLTPTYDWITILENGDIAGKYEGHLYVFDKGGELKVHL